MLRIRKEQVEVFQPVAEAELAQRVMKHVRENHPKVAVQLPRGLTMVNRIADQELLQIVKAGIERAKRYELKWESSISAFVVLMFKAAPNFDEQPAINKRLTEANVSAENRFRNVIDTTPHEIWADAKRRYDAFAWQPGGSKQ